MKKILMLCVAVMMAATSMKAQHEIGGIVGGMNGLSYKYWFSDALALQADLAVGLTEAYYSVNEGGITVTGSKGVYDFTINPNVLYHFDLVSNLKLYTGGGISFGLMDNLKKPAGYNGKVGGKFGIDAVVGLAYELDAVPLVLAFDFRPGYGLGFSKFDDGFGGSGTVKTHYFDWKLAFAVRYKL